jgi:hypothetical protein
MNGAFSPFDAGHALLRLISGLGRFNVLGRFHAFGLLVVVYFSLPPLHLFFGFLLAFKLLLPFSELSLTLLSHKPPVLIQHGPRQGEGRLTALTTAFSPKKNPEALFHRLWG